MINDYNNANCSNGLSKNKSLADHYLKEVTGDFQYKYVPETTEL